MSFKWFVGLSTIASVVIIFRAAHNVILDRNEFAAVLLMTGCFVGFFAGVELLCSRRRLTLETFKKSSELGDLWLFLVLIAIFMFFGP